MKILALETSTGWLSAALWQDGTVSVRRAFAYAEGARLLLPWVRDLLAERALAGQALDGIAFGAGPGSFTGLRLACGTAQGLALGWDVPVIGISSLEALALAARTRMPDQRYVLACLDARLNEVYIAAYGWPDDAPPTASPQCLLLPVVAAADVVQIPQQGEVTGGWLGAGDGFARFAHSLPAVAQCLPDAAPDAEAVAHLAAPRLRRGEGGPAALAQPVYLRDNVALTTAERLARGGVR